MDKSPSLQGETSHHCPDVESGASDQTSVELVSNGQKQIPISLRSTIMHLRGAIENSLIDLSDVQPS